MTDSLDILISILKYINSDDSIEVTNEFYKTSHPMVSAACYLANECLIGEDGHIIRKNIDKVVSQGFPIYPGEMDRFGWLTGCIELSKGIIVFG
jgi:hypothetical protein